MSTPEVIVTVVIATATVAGVLSGLYGYVRGYRAGLDDARAALGSSGRGASPL